MTGDGTVFAEGVDVFVGLAFEVDAVERGAEQGGEVLADGVFVRTEFWFLEDDGDVDVGDLIVGGGHDFDGLVDEDG